MKWLHAEAGLKTHASNLPNPQRGGGTYNRKCTFQQPCLAARVEHIGDLSCVSAVHCLRQSLLHARSRRLHHPLQHECFFQPLYHPTLPLSTVSTSESILPSVRTMQSLSQHSRITVCARCQGNCWRRVQHEQNYATTHTYI